MVRSEPLGLGPLLSASCVPGVHNPAGRGFHHGGGEYGAAACVASGQAQLALAVDDAGTAVVPAAACGAFALRASEGALPLEGMSAACPRLARPALLAADPGLLLRAGRALDLPPKAPSTEAVTCLVAEDFFAACGQVGGAAAGRAS